MTHYPGVMCVPAFRSLEVTILIGIVLRGNEQATCLTSSVCTITSRHTRPGSSSNTVYCSSERCGRRVGVVAGGEALSLASATPAAFPAFGVVPCCAWGGVVGVLLGGVRTHGWGRGPTRCGLTLGPFP